MLGEIASMKTNGGQSYFTIYTFFLSFFSFFLFFFRSLGFDAANVDELEKHLISIAHSEDVREVMPSAHGTKYVVDGILQAPDGRLAQVRTVWIIDVGEDRPRFVTAYPL